MARVAAVVPVIDEREAIGGVVSGLRRAGACCVLVVDGGSRDGTREAAVVAGGTVLNEPRRGYGRACLTGAERALAPAPDGHDHDVVAFHDGDGSCDPADLDRLVTALVAADVALGRRPGPLLEQGALPWHARLGNVIVAGLISVRSGGAIRDLPPFKALRRATLERLNLDDDGYGWTVQLVARALAEPSIRVLEVPVAFRARRGGVSKVSGSWTASIRAGRSMIAAAIRETRPRPIVALMAKAPGPSRAKSRLARDLGEGPTAEFWAACLGDTAAAVQRASLRDRCRSIVVLPGGEDIDPVIQIIGPGWTPIIQSQSGLAAALCHVFLVAFDRGADRAIAVAGDAPGLPDGRIRDALAMLQSGTRPAIVGPSSDGGYHLVGLRWRAVPVWLPHPLRRMLRDRLSSRLTSAFGRVPMGGSSALDDTILSLAAAGWSVSIAAPWPDVDTLADLRRLVRDLESDDRGAPRTADWIRHHRAVIDYPPGSAQIPPPEPTTSAVPAP